MTAADTVTDWRRRTWRVPGDHPAFPGHFPGNPILPGAVLLDQVCRAAEGLCGWRLTGIEGARFTQPLPPGAEVEIRLRPLGQGRAEVEGWLDDARVLRATASFDASLPAPPPAPANDHPVG